MTSTQTPSDVVNLRASADKHLWRHFAQMSNPSRRPLTVMERGEGCYLIDSEENRYLDGLSNLFCVNIGYSHGQQMAEAAAAQYRQLGYHSSWGTTHRTAIELAERVASLAPDGLNHVFFTPSGGEAVEAAWKMARQYFSFRGERRWKALARQHAYHGTTMGALALNGVPDLRRAFEPLVPQVSHISSTRRSLRPAVETDEEFTAFLLDELEQRILSEDPGTIAMVLIEPVQNKGGSLVAPPGYHLGVRELCDRHGILLVADETITAWGRIGAWFASDRLELKPDIITTAKGLTSAQAVMGAVIASDAVYDEFARPGRSFTHGNTYGGHPVSCAVALKNIEIMEDLALPARVRELEGELFATLEQLTSLPVVTEVRGAGFLYSIALRSRHADGTPYSPDTMTKLYGPSKLDDKLFDRRLLLRSSNDGGEMVITVAPPLVAGQAEFDLIHAALADVLLEISEDWVRIPSRFAHSAFE